MLTCSPIRVMHTNRRGFTLIELMVTLGVMAILVVIAAPSFRDALMNVRLTAQVNDLMADLSLARSHAVKTGIPVFLCPSAGPDYTSCSGTAWENGWMVFADVNGDGLWSGTATEPALKSRQAVPAGNTIAVANLTAAGFLAYRPTGVTSATAAANATFRMCDGRTTANRGRLITISPTGRAVVTRITC